MVAGNKFSISPQRRRRYLTGFLFSLPCLVILALMMFTPLLRTFEYSFSKIQFPQLTTTYNGLTNLKKVLSRPEINQVLKNTIVWIFCAVLLRFVIGFGAALMVSGSSGRIKAARLIILLPWTIPSIVTSNTWRWMMQPEMGLFNQVLRSIGMGQFAQNWLGNPDIAIFSVLVAYTWSGFPFVMMMILAGIQGISDELYEAGRIDGANSMQLFWYITIPSLKNVLVSVLILELTSGLNSFDLLFNMTGGGPGGSTEILGLLIHRIGFTNFDFGQASALSVLVILAALVVFLLYGPTQRKKERRLCKL